MLSNPDNATNQPVATVDVNCTKAADRDSVAFVCSWAFAMTERRRFTLAGYGVFDEAMRPIDVGDEVNVVETFPGDEIINDAELPELTDSEKAAMDQATEDFNEFLRCGKICEAGKTITEWRQAHGLIAQRLRNLEAFLNDDGAAMSYQTLGQYRSAARDILAGIS